MESIDLILRPLQPGVDPPHRTEPISVTKLKKGDADWSTCKKVLGWIIDTVAQTITLPERRLHRLAELLGSIPPTQRRLSLEKWYKLLGELRSMSIALPGSRGLFSHLQAALKTRERNTRLRLTPGFHAALDDFRWIHQHLSERPTRLQELVPTTPSVVGTHDASGYAAGGVLFPHHTTPARHVRYTVLNSYNQPVRRRYRSAGPVVWRCTFPPDVTSLL
eukprot:scaffold3500_cov97-Cylindrotheca_fusiformis.AAC.1